MSMPPKPPGRLAEILQQILALSDPTRTSQSDCVSGSDQNELFDAHGAKEDKNQRTP